MRRLLTLILCSLGLDPGWAAAQAPSGHRTALIIGNSAYQAFELPGVSPSLDLLEKALARHSFQVSRHHNLEEKEFKQAVKTFAESIPSNGIGLFYYAGLGAQVERSGKSYNVLRPVGASIKNENDYRSRGQQVGELIKALREQSGSRMNLIFLETGWQSPLKPDTDKVRSGLLAMESPADTLVMFGTGNQVALPVPGKATPLPLASSLAQHIDQFEASIETAVKAVAEACDTEPWSSPAPAGGWNVMPAKPRLLNPTEAQEAGDVYINGLGMTLQWCPPGRFTMGSTRTDSAATRDRQPVEVTLTRGFWMGRYEVTQREYERVTRRKVAPTFTVNKNAPHWGVTEAKQVDDFCKKLNDLEKKAGRLPKGWTYACPTEAEWEYACRAGTTGAYHFGDDPMKLGQYGNVADATLAEANANYHWAQSGIRDGYGEALAPVGSFLPNIWGLHDMHGNVAELVADHLMGDLPGGTDPLHKEKKDGRAIIRGGSWVSTPGYCESSFRNVLPGRDKFNFVGFRITLKKKD